MGPVHAHACQFDCFTVAANGLALAELRQQLDPITSLHVYRYALGQACLLVPLYWCPLLCSSISL